MLCYASFMESITEKIRTLKIPQLEILKILVESKNGVSSAKEIGDTTNTASYSLGAMITPLRRIQTDKGRLIIPAGRDLDNSVRWQINEKVVSRSDLKILLSEMGI